MDAIEKKLDELYRAKRYIALQLYPGVGETTIKKSGNRMFINEGRDGKFEDVDERFYDSMVKKYDSRK